MAYIQCVQCFDPYNNHSIIILQTYREESDLDKGTPADRATEAESNEDKVSSFSTSSVQEEGKQVETVDEATGVKPQNDMTAASEDGGTLQVYYFTPLPCGSSVNACFLCCYIALACTCISYTSMYYYAYTKDIFLAGV